jgi:hypothetical protein
MAFVNLESEIKTSKEKVVHDSKTAERPIENGQLQTYQSTQYSFQAS